METPSPLTLLKVVQEKVPFPCTPWFKIQVQACIQVLNPTAMFQAYLTFVTMCRMCVELIHCALFVCASHLGPRWPTVQHGVCPQASLDCQHFLKFVLFLMLIKLVPASIKAYYLFFFFPLCKQGVNLFRLNASSSLSPIPAPLDFRDCWLRT